VQLIAAHEQLRHTSWVATSSNQLLTAVTPMFTDDVAQVQYNGLACPVLVLGLSFAALHAIGIYDVAGVEAQHACDSIACLSGASSSYRYHRT
jgi:hypothetical protein